MDIVGPLSSNFQSNCAFCDTSIKIGALIEKSIQKRIGHTVITDSLFDSHGSHLQNMSLLHLNFVLSREIWYECFFFVIPQGPFSKKNRTPPPPHN